MTEQKKPADGELMFSAGILAGSLNQLKSSVAQDQVRRVVQWLISLAEEGETRGETKDD